MENGYQEPDGEAEVLVAHCTGLSWEELEQHSGDPLSPAVREKLLGLLQQRIGERIPLPYLTGEAWFAGLGFHVDPRVLIPRSLIENIIDDEEGFDLLIDPTRVTRILDLGTGSGCLAVALARLYPEARVTASDISADALAVAAINRARHRLEGRIRLVQSDLLSALAGERFDLMVSNPPYVPRATWEALPPEYHREPALALLGGDDGLDLVAALLRQAPHHLTPGGVLVCEVGDEVEGIMQQRWPDLPVDWLPFHFGGSGVFAVTKEELAAWLAAGGMA